MEDKEIYQFLYEMMRYWANEFHAEYLLVYDDYSEEVEETKEIFDKYFENKTILDTTNNKLITFSVPNRIPNIDWIRYDNQGNMII